MSKIYYILGYGRSGSTMLDIMLGNQRGVFSCGELSNLMVGHNNSEYCSCGKPLQRCVFWAKVIGDWRESANLTKSDVERFCHLEGVFNYSSRLKSWFIALWYLTSPDYVWYLEKLRCLYFTISKNTDSDVLVDSSKSPLRLINLVRSGIQVEVIHLVRHPVGVAESLAKSHRKNMKKGVAKDLPGKGVRRSSARWAVVNALCHFSIWLTKISALRIRYEDLIRDPAGILALIQEDYVSKATYYPGHLCAGNRLRMQDGFAIEEREPFTNGKVMAITWPLKYFYGY